jgi:hypothetical protein
MTDDRCSHAEAAFSTTNSFVGGIGFVERGFWNIGIWHHHECDGEEEVSGRKSCCRRITKRSPERPCPVLDAATMRLDRLLAVRTETGRPRNILRTAYRASWEDDAEGETYQQSDDSFVIVLDRNQNTSESNTRDTLRHEACHVVAWEKSLSTVPNGKPAWQIKPNEPLSDRRSARSHLQLPQVAGVFTAWLCSIALGDLFLGRIRQRRKPATV